MDFEKEMKQLNKCVDSFYEEESLSTLGKINKTLRRFGNGTYITPVNKDERHEAIEFGATVLFSALYLLGNIID